MWRTDSFEKTLLLGKVEGGREWDDRAWDDCLASPTQWTWVLVYSRSWWWTGKPGVLQLMGSQRVGHDWATELNWTDTFVKTHWTVIFISFLEIYVFDYSGSLLLHWAFLVAMSGGYSLTVGNRLAIAGSNMYFISVCWSLGNLASQQSVPILFLFLNRSQGPQTYILLLKIKIGHS